MFSIYAQKLINDVNEQRDRNWALHEASHCIFLIHFGFTFETASISATLGPNVSKPTKAFDKSNPSEVARFINEVTTILLAGYLATDRKIEEIQDTSDMKEIVNRLDALDMDEQEITRHVERCAGETRKLLKQYRSQIDTLANALYSARVLDYADVRNILNGSELMKDVVKRELQK